VLKQHTAELHHEKYGEHPFADTGQLILLGVFLVIWAVDSFLLHASTFLSAYIPLRLRILAAVLAFLAAVPLFRSGHKVVPDEKRPEEVVTGGAFRYVRHPLYSATMITCLGIALSTLSLLAIALLLPIFIFYNYIASYEERLLVTKFGEEYVAYMTRTGKWFPRRIVSVGR
jgi:protein-S-isoprenylcysteine O-methyltransferase Ste14